MVLSTPSVTGSCNSVKPLSRQGNAPRFPMRQRCGRHFDIPPEILGIDHTKLTYRHNGIDRRLTDVHGTVIACGRGRNICLTALTIAADGGKADISKPLHGMGSGVFEIAIPFRSDAFRVVYAVQLAEEIWVLHAFQKKLTKGIKTPQHEIDLIKDRLKRPKGMLK
jgi:phage-related protein